MGDMPNDVLMFRKSGFSIAMGNASDEVKAQASAVTDSNENEGFAKAVRKFVLPAGNLVTGYASRIAPRHARRRSEKGTHDGKWSPVSACLVGSPRAHLNQPCDCRCHGSFWIESNRPSARKACL